jgi:hypothetical protein
MTESRWSEERASRWYAEQPWWMGCNFTPSTAINQLEMWQAETFDPAACERELRWAAELGMNSVRVFLHDLAWQTDPEGFKERVDRFLSIASGHAIATMLVVFDDCWFPPRAGRQPEPVAGVHNSGWAQSPGHRVVRDRTQWSRLERYVRDVVGAFGRDGRVSVWDLYNEPGNAFLPLAARPPVQSFLPAVARAIRHFALPSPSLALLRATFEWARAMQPLQPLTAGLWGPAWALNRFQLAASDVISFHQYAGPDKLEERIRSLRRDHRRPVLCTEWMARPLGSRFETHLPIFREHRVGCYCWGLVAGKTQTIHGWNDRPGTPEPAVWHHDVLRTDGSAYDPGEVETIRRLTER